MMEAPIDPTEVPSGGNKVSTGNDKKRKFKSPAQVKALENFYSEHKYPTEEMKAKFTEQVGLTEKQVSGWFCHRRLKDKKLLKVEEGSVEVMRDCQSGVKQDSHGSAKKGDDKNIDPKEVESQRVYRHDFSAADVKYEQKVKHKGHFGGNVMKSTSPESSSFFQDTLLSPQEGLYDPEISRHLKQNGAILPSYPQLTKPVGYRSSGYLKVKGDVENSAITVVRMQLGKHYMEDGPRLGTKFDLLPPGAFESPITDIVNGPMYIGNARRLHSPEVPGLLNPGYEVHKSKMGTQAPLFVGSKKYVLGSGCQNGKRRRQIKQKSPLICANPFSGQNSSPEMFEGPACETSLCNSNSKIKRSSKHDVEMMIYDGTCGGNFSSEPFLNEYDNITPKIVRKSEGFTKPSHTTLERSNSPEARGRGPYSGMVEKLHQGKKPVKEYQDHGIGKIHSKNDRPAAEQVGAQLLQHHSVTKTSYCEMSPQNSQRERSPPEIQSSSSEEGTMETSSSKDL